MRKIHFIRRRTILAAFLAFATAGFAFAAAMALVLQDDAQREFAYGPSRLIC
jgi:hypothetical protein